jgi:hypothetical protein
MPPTEPSPCLSSAERFDEVARLLGAGLLRWAAARAAAARAGPENLSESEANRLESGPETRLSGRAG